MRHINRINNCFLSTCSKTLLFLLTCFSSCVFPDPIDNLSPTEKDIYVTNRDKSVNFSNYKTYVILDSVKVVSISLDSINKPVSSSALILNTINSELQKTGFVKVDTSQNPDVGISVSMLDFTVQAPTNYYPYLASGTGYFGYVSPAFYGFPGSSYGFPPYYGYYQIQIGSISIEMFDLKTARASGGNNLNVIWSAVLAGTLQDTNTDINTRIVNAITAAFAQSPYLKDGK